MKKIKNNKFNSKYRRGAASILLTIFVLTIILLIATTAAQIMVFEIKMSGQNTDSVVAFYAADAAAEQCLYQAIKDAGPCQTVDSGNPAFSLTLLSNGATAVATRSANDIISTTGRFNGIDRAILITGDDVVGF